MKEEALWEEMVGLASQEVAPVRWCHAGVGGAPQATIGETE